MVRECLVYLTIALVVIGCAHLAKPKTPQLEMSQLEHEVDEITTARIEEVPEDKRDQIAQRIAEDLAGDKVFQAIPEIRWTSGHTGTHPDFLAFWYDTGRVCYGWYNVPATAYKIEDCGYASPMHRTRK
jgi:hypothetical protein